MRTESVPPSPEAVDAAMRLLSRVPKTWAAVPELSHLESQGLGLLMAGTLIERRVSLQLRAVGDERAVAVRFRFTGQEGLADAVEPALAEAWVLWQALWKEGKKIYVVPPEGEGEWRLSAHGDEAAQKIADGDVGYLHDVLRTPGVPGTGAMPPHLRFVPGVARRVFAGEGHVERVEVVNAGSEPLSVNVRNLDEVSGPLGDIARIMQQGLEHLRGPTQTEGPAREEGSRRGPARLAFDDARRYVRLLGRWADVQDRNKGNPRREQTTKAQFARANNVTEPDVKAAQAWYRNHRHTDGFPRDPRQLSDEQLRRHFPKRG